MSKRTLFFIVISCVLFLNLAPAPSYQLLPVAAAAPISMAVPSARAKPRRGARVKLSPAASVPSTQTNAAAPNNVSIPTKTNVSEKEWAEARIWQYRIDELRAKGLHLTSAEIEELEQLERKVSGLWAKISSDLTLDYDARQRLRLKLYTPNLTASTIPTLYSVSNSKDNQKPIMPKEKRDETDAEYIARSFAVETPKGVLAPVSDWAIDEVSGKIIDSVKKPKGVPKIKTDTIMSVIKPVQEIANNGPVTGGAKALVGYVVDKLPGAGTSMFQMGVGYVQAFDRAAIGCAFYSLENGMAELSGREPKYANRDEAFNDVFKSTFENDNKVRKGLAKFFLGVD